MRKKRDLAGENVKEIYETLKEYDVKQYNVMYKKLDQDSNYPGFNNVISKIKQSRSSKTKEKS